MFGSMRLAKSSGSISRSCSTGGVAEDHLIQHARSGCLECKNQLIERNADRLRSFVVRIMFASPDSEDIFQQTICRALIKFQQFRGDASFLTWLSSIALNEMRQFIRKRRRALLLSLQEEQFRTSFRNEPNESPLDFLCRAEVRTSVRRALEALPSEFRRVIELHDFEGLSLQDTAKLLDLSLPAAKSRHFRARKHLVRAMGSASPPVAGCHRRNE
jgi:RNA polymerase sigma-70 factor, ECF subfamily